MYNDDYSDRHAEADCDDCDEPLAAFDNRWRFRELLADVLRAEARATGPGTVIDTDEGGRTDAWSYSEYWAGRFRLAKYVHWAVSYTRQILTTKE